MNDAQIEKILSQAPSPHPPGDLLGRLHAEIALPSRRQLPDSRAWHPSLRRWFPALAFGVLMLSCALMIAVQANWNTNLIRQNEQLRAATGDLPKLREQHVGLENARARQDELAQLQQDNNELHQLQTQVVQLRTLSGQTQRLQTENRRLAATPDPVPTLANWTEFSAEAKTQAERIQCVNNLKQLGLAARVWAGDNGDKYPTSMVVMSNECSTVKILICPSDIARLPYRELTFAQFRDDMSSYPWLAQPDDQSFPDRIMAKCPIHHNYLLADGSVQSVNPDKVREVQRDGRLYLEWLH